MNEEKEELWFVWEKVSRGGMVSNKQPAIYRGMPQTGSEMAADNDRFVFKHKVLAFEQDWNLAQFIKRYPCPEVKNEEAKPRDTAKDIIEDTTTDRLARKDNPHTD